MIHYSVSPPALVEIIIHYRLLSIMRHKTSKKYFKRLRYKKWPALSEFSTGSLRKTLCWRTLAEIHVLPPLAVCANPAWRKLDDTLSNCLQPMLILFPFVGSTQMDGSFAASPTTLLPFTLTLT